MGNLNSTLYTKQAAGKTIDAVDIANKVKVAYFVSDPSSTPAATDVVFLGKLPAGAKVLTNLAVMSGTFALGDVTPALTIGSTAVIASQTLSAAAKQLTGGAGILALTADTDVKITVGAGLVPSDFKAAIVYTVGC